MNHRELLELAGRAQGWFDYPNDGVEAGSVWHTDKDKAPFDHSFSKASWNPLTDDGAALRLAVKLDISIDFVDKCAWKRHQGKLIQEYWGGDYDPSYKHAIVRVAAAIAEQEEKE